MSDSAGTGAPPGPEDVLRAAATVRPHVHRTPVLTSSSLDRELGARISWKCENLQKTGAFKIRGATNAVLSLSPDEARRGVATHSSGNHGAALARAAAERGIACHVVVPAGASPVKLAALAAYGAQVVECAPTQAAREAGVAEVIERTGATLVHPYDDAVVVAGQGTAALELLADAPDLDLLLVPLGGGGLTSGSALAVAAADRRVQLVGVEPAGADDAARSLAAGRITPVAEPRTVADGLRATIGVIPFRLLRERGVDVVTVSDEHILASTRLLWERLKVVVEPSAAVGLAAMLSGAVAVAGRRVGVILSGGNVAFPGLG